MALSSLSDISLRLVASTPISSERSSSHFHVMSSEAIRLATPLMRKRGFE